MRNANRPSRQRGVATRGGEPGVVHAQHRSAVRAEVAKAIEDLSAIMDGLDMPHCRPADVPAATIQRRQNHVRR